MKRNKPRNESRGHALGGWPFFHQAQKRKLRKLRNSETQKLRDRRNVFSYCLKRLVLLIMIGNCQNGGNFPSGTCEKFVIVVGLLRCHRKIAIRRLRSEFLHGSGDFRPRLKSENPFLHTFLSPVSKKSCFWSMNSRYAGPHGSPPAANRRVFEMALRTLSCSSFVAASPDAPCCGAASEKARNRSPISRCRSFTRSICSLNSVIKASIAAFSSSNSLSIAAPHSMA